MSLEPPPLWPRFFGQHSDARSLYEGLDVERLEAYIRGFQRSTLEKGGFDDEAEQFFRWLTETKEGTWESWAAFFLKKARGNHEVAIRRFFDLLHDHLLMHRPQWFLTYNRRPQPSQFHTEGSATPVLEDVRLPAHVRAVSSGRARPRRER